MMIGPPAMPSFTGALMPGMVIGIMPSARPRSSPKNMAPRLGSLRPVTALPRNASAWSMSSGVPTTVTRSPYCRWSVSVASSLMSPRITLDTFTPYVSRMCSEPSVLPFRRLRVITITRLSTDESIAFQSILSRFQSFFTCSPKRMFMAATSSRLVTTSTLSPCCITVCAIGTITFPLRQMREMMKWRWVDCDICAIVLSEMAGLTQMNCPTYVLSSSELWQRSRSSLRTRNLRSSIMAKMTPTTPSG